MKSGFEILYFRLIKRQNQIHNWSVTAQQYQLMWNHLHDGLTDRFIDCGSKVDASQSIRIFYSCPTVTRELKSTMKIASIVTQTMTHCFFLCIGWQSTKCIVIKSVFGLLNFLYYDSCGHCLLWIHLPWSSWFSDTPRRHWGTAQCTQSSELTNGQASHMNLSQSQGGLSTVCVNFILPFPRATTTAAAGFPLQLIVESRLSRMWITLWLITHIFTPSE